MAQSHTVYRWQCWDLRPAGISRFVPVADKLWVWLLSPLWSQIHHLSKCHLPGRRAIGLVRCLPLCHPGVTISTVARVAPGTSSPSGGT